MANLNPLMLLSLLKGNGPQSVAQQLFQNNFQSNPNMQSLMQLARSGNSQGVEQFAKNYFQQILNNNIKNEQNEELLKSKI